MAATCALFRRRDVLVELHALEHRDEQSHHRRQNDAHKGQSDQELREGEPQAARHSHSVPRVFPETWLRSRSMVTEEDPEKPLQVTVTVAAYPAPGA